MRKITLTLLTAAGAAALSGLSVRAADLYVPVPEPVYVPVYTWTGFYTGVHAGYGWGEAENDGKREDCLFEECFDVEVHADTIDLDGFIAGSQAGYNHQFGNFVLGVEADLSWTGLEGDTPVTDIDGFEIAKVEHEFNWLGTARVRAGFTLGRFLVYATGGLAFAEVDTRLKVPGFFDYERERDNTHVGWSAGAGIEGFITPKLTAKIEYIYTDLGEEESDLFDANFFDIYTIEGKTDTDLTVHTIRAGLNYKFDGFW